MKILVIIPCWHIYRDNGDVGDGISRYCVNIIDKLVAKGHQVAAIVPHDAICTKDVGNSNLTYYYLGKPSGESTQFKERLPWANYKGVISRVLRNFNPDAILNQAQHHSIAKAINSLGVKDITIHYSHGNPDGFIGRRFIDEGINIVSCGVANMEAWNNLKRDYVQDYITLPTELESEELVNRRISSDRLITVSRLFPDKGVEEYLQLAKDHPTFDFFLFGSKCHIKNEKGVTVTLFGESVTRDYYEDCIEYFINKLPNVYWLNKDENWSRHDTICYLKNFNGIGVSLSKVEAGSTLGCEFKALGIPMLTYFNTKSNFMYHINHGNNDDLIIGSSDLGYELGYRAIRNKLGIVVNTYDDKEDPVEFISKYLSYYCMFISENCDRKIIKKCVYTLESHYDKLMRLIFNLKALKTSENP